MTKRDNRNEKPQKPKPIEKRPPTDLLKEAEALDTSSQNIGLLEEAEPEDIENVVGILIRLGEQLDRLTRDLQAHYKWEPTQNTDITNAYRHAYIACDNFVQAIQTLPTKIKILPAEELQRLFSPLQTKADVLSRRTPSEYLSKK